MASDSTSASAANRIDRMQADGLISEAQAELLRRAIGGRKSAVAAEARRVDWRMIAAIVGGVLLVLILALLAFGGGEAPVQDVGQSLNQPGAFGEMNKSLSTVLAIALLLIVPILLFVWLYNGLVGKEEQVFEAWATTESTLQRRADLVPALIETVSRYLRHEAETFEGVAVARGQATAQLATAVEALAEAEAKTADLLSAMTPDALADEARLAELFAAQATVGRGIVNLTAVAEAYPELRSADQFLELQAQLEGTENRINIARIRFNEAVATYNAAMRRIPGSWIAGLGGFRRKAYFRSDEEARDAPGIDFD